MGNPALLLLKSPWSALADRLKAFQMRKELWGHNLQSWPLCDHFSFIYLLIAHVII